ncbi:carbon storage regulator CsrA [Paenibacillus sp. 453mf]|uniref:carbon storage regulator CsrA n=1 Tax=Paenibacillus sp. 453mf TaxID=1761874 RepID=UPI0008F339E2|nr:carbon storage regulator CsrA [Paenibacillus sp. 453mf]SFS85291.1 carbon storage regulator, CsrA [Paenibacillus sp. 453mf]
MLVLSRKKGESIVIDEQIEVTVLGVEGDTIRIGIQAPAEVDIFRKEVHLAIQETNRQSAAPNVENIQALMQQYQQTIRREK